MADRRLDSEESPSLTAAARAVAPFYRATLLALAGLLLLPAHEAVARGGRSSSLQSDSGLVNLEQRRSIERAQEWIAKAQQPGGHWGEEDGTKVADTALSTLALMAGGNTVGAGRTIRVTGPNSRVEGPPQLRGPHARAVLEGIRYLARKAWEDVPGKTPGYIQDDTTSKMHGHGFATLALAQASGNLGGTDVRDIRAWLKGGAGRDASQLSLADQVRWGLARAVRVIERAQDPDSGGWLYDPIPNGHEGSMTVTQIHALRAARDVGIAVSDVTLRRAYNYVRGSQNLHNRELYGGFAYQKTNKQRVSYSLTAAALSTFFGLGRYGDEKGDTKIITDGMKFLDRRFDDALHTRQWFYYGVFYGAQAIYQQNDARRLREQWPRIRAQVIAQQQTDGSFNPVGGDGRSREYSTAMGCLTLQVPLETLPIFQRR